MTEQPNITEYIQNASATNELIAGIEDEVARTKLAISTPLWNAVQAAIPDNSILAEATSEEQAIAWGRLYGISSALATVAFQWGMAEGDATESQYDSMSNYLHKMNQEIRAALKIPYEHSGNLSLFDYPTERISFTDYKTRIPLTPEEIFKRVAIESYIEVGVPTVLTAIEQIPNDQIPNEIHIMRNCLGELSSGESDPEFGVIQMFKSLTLPDTEYVDDPMGTLPGTLSKGAVSKATWGLDFDSQFRMMGRYPNLRAVLLFYQSQRELEFSARESSQINTWFNLIGPLARPLADNLRTRIGNKITQYKVSELLYAAASGANVAEIGNYDDLASESNYFLHNPLALETILAPDDSNNAFRTWNMNRLQGLYRTQDSLDESDAAYDYAAEYLEGTRLDDNSIVESLATETDYQTLEERDFNEWMNENGYDSDLAKLGSEKYLEAYRSYKAEYQQALEYRWRVERLVERTTIIERWASIRDGLPESSIQREAMQQMLDYTAQFMAERISDSLVRRMNGNLNHQRMNLLIKHYIGQSVRAWGRTQMHFSNNVIAIHNSTFPDSTPSTVIAQFDNLSGEYLAFSGKYMNQAIAAREFFGPEDTNDPSWKDEYENNSMWTDFQTTIISIRRALGLPTV